jgi:hypothetical protein
MRLEQQIMVGAYAGGGGLPGHGAVEDSTDRHSIEVTGLSFEADDALGELVHNDEYPMGVQQNGLTAKEIDTPETVFRVPKEGQPRGASAPARSRPIMPREGSPDHILVDADAECLGDLLRDPRATESGIALLELDDRTDELWRWTLGPDLPCLGDEKSRRYLRFFRGLVESEQRRGADDDGSSPDSVWAEKQRPEAEQNSVKGREFERASPRPVDEQGLVLHEKALRDNRSCATGSQELGDRGQQMRQEGEKVLHG